VVQDIRVAFHVLYVYYYITKQKSFIIMKMKMYSILDKAKLHTENIKGLNLATVIYTTVQVSRLLW
jgi:hypothetical protein